MVREKIIEAASKKLIILVGTNKLVHRLGEHGKLPIEIVPVSLPLVQRRLSDLGVTPVLWADDKGPHRSENGNYILDCAIPAPGLANPAEFEAAARAIPGVVGTGLFLKMATLVLVGDQDNNFAFVDEKQRSAR